MTAFGMLYSCFLASPEVRDALSRASIGPTARRSHAVIDNLERLNPELLKMAHGYAAPPPVYGRTMQGFGLLHEALLIHSQRHRTHRH